MASMSPEADEMSILETIREASPSHFLLKVESFSLLRQHGIHRYETGEFNAGGYKWRLVLCPNEDKSDEDKNYISVYLAISDTASLKTEVNAFFSIFLLNQISGNYNYSPGRTRCFTTVKSEWGISKFISKKVLNEPSNGFIINDNCAFGVEVFIVGCKKDDFPLFGKHLVDFKWVMDCFTLKSQTNDEYEYHNETVLPEDTILETREASPTHFQMKIDLFSLLGEHRIHNCQRGKFVARGYKWRLTICTNEDKTGPESNYISVYLAISDTYSLQRAANWEVNAVFSVFLFNQISGKYHHSLGRTRRFLAMKSEWGISNFISKKALMDPSNGFLINNNCVFGAEVFVINKLAVSECLSMKSATIPYRRDWKISNLFELGHMWTSEKFHVGGVSWYIVLYPRGYNNAKGCSEAMGVYLYLVDSKRVKAWYSVCIKDQIKYKQEKSIGNQWFSPTTFMGGGCGRFMEVSRLKDPKNGFIINDTCHLEIEISVQAIV